MLLHAAGGDEGLSAFPPGKKINISQVICPMRCGLLSSYSLGERLKDFKRSLDMIHQMTVERSKREGLTLEAGFRKYEYYTCFSCKSPYYGGDVVCNAGLGVPEGGEVDPSTVKCPPCKRIRHSTCPSHGTEHINYKCNFCCEAATFFCGGRTHFCEACHKSGWSASTKPCPGIGICPIDNGNHVPNPCEMALGCGHPDCIWVISSSRVATLIFCLQK